MMFERITIEAARADHERAIAQANAHGAQVPLAPTWWSRLRAALRRRSAATPIATVHPLPAPRPAAVETSEGLAEAS
jgi:hypothetical protein